jgi:drug/metabolite transporter (DMT)-like permease
MRILVAFAAVYLIWGSTYLAIRFAIETIPPLLMAGIRFIVAGTLLYAWARWRGAEKPAPAHWRSAIVIGVLLLLLGNGGVTWAELFVPSGIAALMVATTPLWIVLLDWVWQGGKRPTLRTTIGLLAGFIGILVLIGPNNLLHGQGLHPYGVIAMLIASVAWAAGSLHSRRAPLPQSPLLATGMEMLCGGGMLLLAGLLSGETGNFHFAAISLRSVLSLIYLIVFGAIIGFTAFIWLLRVTTPARVSTYAYINPIIAIFLGWALAGEPLTGQTLFAAAIIVVAVILIVTSPAPQRRPVVAREQNEERRVEALCLEEA